MEEGAAEPALEPVVLVLVLVIVPAMVRMFVIVAHRLEQHLELAPMVEAVLLGFEAVKQQVLEILVQEVGQPLPQLQNCELDVLNRRLQERNQNLGCRVDY
jgi:hypothetical protein